HLAAFEQGFHFTQEDRGIVSAAIIHRLADIASPEQCVVAKVCRHFGYAVGCRTHGEQVHDLCVLYEGGASDQSFDQGFGLGAAGVDIYSHARLHARYRLLRRNQLAAVLIDPRHRQASSSKPKQFPTSLSSRRWHARAPARRSKWQDERTCPAFPAVPSRQKFLPGAPVQRVFASSPKGSRGPGKSSIRLG